MVWQSCISFLCTFKLLTCPDDQLSRFMDPSESCNLADVLIAGGFPHLEVCSSTRVLAYECVVRSEVITKRVPALDDLRNGLVSESYMGLNLLDIARSHAEVQLLIFPLPGKRIMLIDLWQLVKFDDASDEEMVNSKRFMEKYLEELDVRGKEEVVFS